MIIFEDKTYQTCSLYPNKDWTGEAKYIVDDNSEIANKVRSSYPFYDFITDENDNLIDIEVLENPNELVELKQEKVIQSKLQLAEFLENKPLLYNNELYSVTQEKQSLLTSAIAAYQLKVQAGIPAELKWNTTGDICREFTLEEITGLVVAITEYVQPRVEKQQALEVQIRNAETLEELDSIVIDYEVV